MEEESSFTPQVGQTYERSNEADSPSESPSGSRHSLLDMDDEQTRRNKKKDWWLKCLVCVAFVLCVIASAFFLGKHIGPTTEKSKLSEPSRGPSSQAHKGNEEIFAQLLSDKYFLLNFDTKCEEPVCTKCKAQVTTPSHNHGERGSCETDPRVKSSTCFECGNTCKNVSEIRADLICNGQGIPPPCCIITQMRGNTYCGPEGVYECYGPTVTQLQPKCKCPSGKGGERCQEDTKIDLTCKCYNTPLEAGGQDSMEKCANVTEFNSSNKCQMYAYKAGQKHNCECSKKDDDDDTELGLCSTPHTDAQYENVPNVSNDCTRSSWDFILILSLFLVASLLDKR